MKINSLSNKTNITEGIYRTYFKRPLDILFSISAIVVLSPVFFILAVIIRNKLGSPILFKQSRIGFKENIFTMYKFRSMTDERSANGELLPDGDRLSTFGNLLRSTSIDELPELINILKGDMSIVGPRPQLVRDMAFMTEEQRARHQVMPGLTGLAQISGRNNLKWEKRLFLDLEYSNNISFSNDLKIIILTISKVLKKADVQTHGLETSEDLGDYLLRIGEISQNEYEEKLIESKVYRTK